MIVEDFKELLTKDTTLLPNIELLQNHLDDDEVITQLFNLCRETFLTQYNADVFRNEEGNLSYIIFDKDFKSLSNHIKEFLILIDRQDNQIAFDEVIKVLKKYYRKTATTEETKGRSHYEENKKGGFASFGTYYDLNRIDWDYFIKGIKENSKS